VISRSHWQRGLCSFGEGDNADTKTNKSHAGEALA
jgi:hypothetical protein